MSRRTAAWTAWSMCAISLVLTALGLFLLVLNLYNSKVDIFDYWAEVTVMAIAFSIVGGVFASGRPENPIGWLCCVIGLMGGLGLFSTEYAVYTLLVVPRLLL